ncbi:uncharacterized protein SEPMUDRAFT_148570 [Sphaerulina musiva SO2202]|uniref:Uncharacterized protein n=1 Tax=Sphaerulina musiva (strain SO2202) TaxID=692275 RepID=M3B079_SPHMS|nr:uncharacterized protein SEPMUDRAFT_148570 [Sphaerulina musiva SO2202]EMF13197.1 hypothetical protein SEPMUDRAFT_148570 [Sphaerulina musiva SO2202]
MAFGEKQPPIWEISGQKNDHVQRWFVGRSSLDWDATHSTHAWHHRCLAIQLIRIDTNGSGTRSSGVRCTQSERMAFRPQRFRLAWRTYMTVLRKREYPDIRMVCTEKRTRRRVHREEDYV